VVPLPSGARPLRDFVTGPEALSRRLAMTGVVFPDQGKALQAVLQPGQRLVSPRGDLWRWDGYSASSDAPSAAAVRLSQRNRLAALDGEIEHAREHRATIFAAWSAARDAVNAARDTQRARERDERNTDQSLIAAEESRNAAEAELERLGDGVALTNDVATARGRNAEARTAYSEARATLDGLKREGENRARRLVSIGDERSRWDERSRAALAHIEDLERRHEELSAELATVEALPEAIAAKRGTLLDAIA